MILSKWYSKSMLRSSHPQNIKIGIVIPVHNRKEITLQCLHSLSFIDRSGLDIHTIVINDGSTDGTGAEIRLCFPEVYLIEGDGNLWYTGGTNIGIQSALLNNPDYILTINDDSIFPENFLQCMVSCAEKNPGSIVGPLLLDWNQSNKVFAVAPRWNTWYGGWQHHRNLTIESVPKEAWEVELIVGNCVLYPVAAIKQHGLMKANLHYGDAEYTPRMRKAGWRLLIEPSARILCQPNTATPSMSKLPKRQILQTYFVDQHSTRHLIMHLKTLWYSAPTHITGLCAFIIFTIRLSLKVLLKKIELPYSPDPPLKLTQKIHYRKSNKRALR